MELFLFKKQSRRSYRMMLKNKTNTIPLSVIPENDDLVVRFPDSTVLKVIARFVLLGLLIVTFPWIQSGFPNFLISSSNTSSTTSSSSGDAMMLPRLFQDMINEGLYKLGDKALFIQNGELKNAKILIDNGVELVSEFDIERQSSVPDSTFYMVFTSGWPQDSAFVDRVVRNNGIVVVELSNEVSKAFPKPENYKIVYLRRFKSTIIAMKKMGSGSSTAMRRLLAIESEAKKALLNGLEDVLLEPPRGSSKTHSKYLKKTKYLPDLLGDSLDEYPRRVFIDVGSTERNGASTEWFRRNYPMRNQVFDVYKIEMVSEESSTPQLGVSDWLSKNVREEEYVVMKAEAEAVEEMMSSKAIGLVDELFLECKHQWQKKNKGRRAYWECLALYGRLRDEGIAVHQWWG